MDLGAAKRSRSPSAASPGDPLGPFPSLGKDLAPQGETLPQAPTPTAFSLTFRRGAHRMKRQGSGADKAPEELEIQLEVRPCDPLF